jgi:hypothetical protein
VGGLRGGYIEPNLKLLAGVARDWKVKQIVVESNFGDGMFVELFKPVLAKYYPGGCAIEEVRSVIQKEKRIIDTLEPLLNQHRIILDPRVIEADLKVLSETIRYSLFYQLTHITRDRGSLAKDDRVDALALLAAYWMSAMARSEFDAEADWKQRQIDLELQNFMQGIMVGGPRVEPQGFAATMRNGILNRGRDFGKARVRGYGRQR